MPSTIIEKIQIKHSGNVIVDTVPPKGTFNINSGNRYTNSERVKIGVDASDETTEVDKMFIRNIDVTLNSDGSQDFTKYEFQERDFKEEFYWGLVDNEGIKKVEINFDLFYIVVYTLY